MDADLSSRRRMLAALEGRPTDRVPCCFMIFSALRSKCASDEEFVRKQVELGLDTVVETASWTAGRSPEHRDLPGLHLRYPEGTEIRYRRETGRGGRPVLHKEYVTPAGTLTAAATITEDWPYPGVVPLFDDYLIPRSQKFLIETRQDLEVLRFLLADPAPEDAAQFQQHAAEAKALAAELDLLVTGGMGVGLEAGGWLCGLEQLVLRALDEPDFVTELVELLHAWNLKRMQVVLGADVDLFVRRGWYEGTDFWSPELFRAFVYPYLQREAALAHEQGAKFGYINTSGTMPVLDQIIEAGVDVLIGVDPVEGKGTDLAEMKRRAEGRIALWGGVNGFITVEGGSEEEIRQAVHAALGTLGPTGFILSPVDNIRDESPATWRNVQVFIQAWKEARQ